MTIPESPARVGTATEIASAVRKGDLTVPAREPDFATFAHFKAGLVDLDAVAALVVLDGSRRDVCPEM